MSAIIYLQIVSPDTHPLNACFPILDLMFDPKIGDYLSHLNILNNKLTLVSSPENRLDANITEPYFDVVDLQKGFDISGETDNYNFLKVLNRLHIWLDGKPQLVVTSILGETKIGFTGKTSCLVEEYLKVNKLELSQQNFSFAYLYLLQNQFKTPVYLDENVPKWITSASGSQKKFFTCKEPTQKAAQWIRIKSTQQ